MSAFPLDAPPSLIADKNRVTGSEDFERLEKSGQHGCAPGTSNAGCKGRKSISSMFEFPVDTARFPVPLGLQFPLNDQADGQVSAARSIGR
jgi:hypothetical protein